jgi:hypothetical protein
MAASQSAIASLYCGGGGGVCVWGGGGGVITRSKFRYRG